MGDGGLMMRAFAILEIDSGFISLINVTVYGCYI